MKELLFIFPILLFAYMGWGVILAYKRDKNEFWIKLWAGVYIIQWICLFVITSKAIGATFFDVSWYSDPEESSFGPAEALALVFFWLLWIGSKQAHKTLDSKTVNQ